MKRRFMYLSLVVAFLYLACTHTGIVNMKDLSDNMLDVRIYQENLGDEISEGKLQDAVWLLEGMDSILLLIGEKFTKHRKLPRGFAYYYRKELQKPINKIRTAIRKNDTSMAIGAYKLMVQHCNDCHIDHDIDKTVRE